MRRRIEPIEPVREPSPQARRAPPAWWHRFLFRIEVGAHDGAHAHPWWKVLWLTGVDYFSTLGYQPGIAFLAAGVLSPLATGVLILVTLFAAVPVYSLVARYSYIGQGSIAMLESLLSGWKSKVAVLLLLGFAATDFIITMTLSAADAAQHMVENPLLHDLLGDHRVLITCVLLGLLATVFLIGFREAIGVALVIGVPYLLLTFVIGVRGVVEIATHPDAFTRWTSAVGLRGDWTGLLLASAIIFPRLALGMSGFETGVSVMPLIAGPDAPDAAPPMNRVRNTRKMLLTAAAIMSVMLLLSSFVTTLLIPNEAFATGGKANGRAMAYLAHSLLGEAFGTAYDLSTIAILWFAGASAMAGLLNLVPRYLPRFGMAPEWTLHTRPLVLLLFGISVVVTLIFQADVDAQAGAYATGVLVLMLSAAVAVAIATWREARTDGRLPWHGLYFWAVSGVFLFTLADNVIERPDGVIIASLFILLVVTVSGISRMRRAFEMRVQHFAFDGPESEAVWSEIRGKKMHLVPIAYDTPEHLGKKLWRMRNYYRVEGPVAFLLVRLRDDRSEFSTELRLRVERWADGHVFIEATGAVAVPNTIAWVSEALDPISIFLTLTRRNAMSQSFKYLLWGEGEIGIVVYHVLLRHWESTPEDDVRPRIFLVSES